MTKIPINPYTKYILVKLLHSRIVTNQKLVEKSLVHNPSCPYCNASSETMLHAFINCHTVKDFGKKIEKWLQDIVEPQIEIGVIENFFGLDTPDNIVSRVIIVAIQVIYQERQLRNLYDLFDVKRLLANQMMLEESLAITNNQETQIEKTWGPVYLDLSGLG